MACSFSSRSASPLIQVALACLFLVSNLDCWPGRRLLKEHAKAHHADDDRVFFSPSRVGKSKYHYHDPFVAAVKAAGLEDFHFHDLRHSAATYLARDGASSQQLKAVGGWKSNAVDKYVHLAANDVKDLLAGLSEKVGGAGEQKGKDSD